MKFSENDLELFNDALESGIINLDAVRNDMIKKKREAILANHPYSIWQGKDGRWRSYLEDKTHASGRKLIVKTDKAALEKLIINFYEANDEKVKLENITLEMLYPEWLEYKRLHTTAPTYITRIDTDWKTYYAGTEIVSIPLRNLTKLQLDNWAHTLIQQHNMTKNMYYNVTVIMRQALLYACEKGILTESPFAGVHIDGKRLFRKQRKKPSQTQVFTEKEQMAISKLAWEDFENHTKVYELSPLALLFQFQTGLRIGELCVVKYSDIERKNYIHIQRMLRRDTGDVVEHTKTECGDRQVYLTPEALTIISAAKKRQEELGTNSNEYIFSINGKPLTERSIADLYRKYCKKLGIVQKSSHKSRKTYISQLIDGGVNLNTIREMVGHADEHTTLGNYCFDRNEDKEKESAIDYALKIKAV